jgi:hypothetical protein
MNTGNSNKNKGERLGNTPEQLMAQANENMRSEMLEVEQKAKQAFNDRIRQAHVDGQAMGGLFATEPTSVVGTPRVEVSEYKRLREMWLDQTRNLVVDLEKNGLPWYAQDVDLVTLPDKVVYNEWKMLREKSIAVARRVVIKLKDTFESIVEEFRARFSLNGPVLVYISGKKGNMGIFTNLHLASEAVLYQKVVKELVELEQADISEKSVFEETIVIDNHKDNASIKWDDIQKRMERKTDGSYYMRPDEMQRDDDEESLNTDWEKPKRSWFYRALWNKDEYVGAEAGRSGHEIFYKAWLSFSSVWGLMSFFFLIPVMVVFIFFAPLLLVLLLPIMFTNLVLIAYRWTKKVSAWTAFITLLIAGVSALIAWMIRRKLGQRKEVKDEEIDDGKTASILQNLVGSIGIVMLPFTDFLTAGKYASAAHSLGRSVQSMGALAANLGAFVTGFTKKGTTTIKRVYYIGINGKVAGITVCEDSLLKRAEGKHLLAFYHAPTQCWRMATHQKDGVEYVVLHVVSADLLRKDLKNQAPIDILLKRARDGKDTVGHVMWDTRSQDYVEVSGPVFQAEDLSDSVGPWTSQMISYTSNLAAVEGDDTHAFGPGKEMYAKMAAQGVKLEAQRFVPSSENRFFKNRSGACVDIVDKLHKIKEAKKLQKGFLQTKHKKEAEAMQVTIDELQKEYDELEPAYMRYLQGDKAYWISSDEQKGKEKEDELIVEDDQQLEVFGAKDLVPQCVVEGLTKMQELGAKCRSQCCGSGFKTWVTKWKVLIMVFFLVVVAISILIFRIYSKRKAAKKGPWVNQRKEDQTQERIQTWMLQYGDGKEMEFKPHEPVWVSIKEQKGNRMSYAGVTDDLGRIDIPKMLSSYGHVAGEYPVLVTTGELSRPFVRLATLTLKTDLPKKTELANKVIEDTRKEVSALQAELKPGNKGARAVKKNAKEHSLMQQGAQRLKMKQKRQVMREEASRLLKEIEEIDVKIVKRPEGLPTGMTMGDVLSAQEMPSEDVDNLNKALDAFEANEHAFEANVPKGVADQVAEAYINADQGTRFLYVIGTPKTGGIAECHRVLDTLQTKEHVLDALDSIKAATVQIVNCKDSSTVLASFPYVRKDWVKLDGIEDTVALPLPLSLCNMPATNYELVNPHEKSFEAKFFSCDPASFRTSMDSVNVAVIPVKDGFNAAYHTDHKPGISGSFIAKDANPVKIRGTHTSGSRSTKLCYANLFTQRWLDHTIQIGLNSPTRQAMARFKNVVF